LKTATQRQADDLSTLNEAVRLGHSEALAEESLFLRFLDHKDFSLRSK